MANILSQKEINALLEVTEEMRFLDILNILKHDGKFQGTVENVKVVYDLEKIQQIITFLENEVKRN